jgi:hypothetical protein
MPPRSALAVAVLAGLAVLCGSAGAATGGPKTINTNMSGIQAVPSGEPKGRGSAKITLNAAKGKVCFDLTWAKIGTPTAAHIHKGATNKSGNVVVPLFAGKAKHKGCVSAAKTVVAAIVKKPDGYYVNVHTSKYPAGAIRGQL